MTAQKTVKKTATTKTTKSTDSKRWNGVQLPSGYEAIAVGEFGQPWDFEQHPLLEGVVSGDVRTVEAGTGKNKRESRVVTIKSDDGALFDVWESAALRGFFEQIEDGVPVAIAFQGYRDIGRPQPMKVFQAGIREGATAKKIRR
jgi:hypothetical protein